MRTASHTVFRTAALPLFLSPVFCVPVVQAAEQPVQISAPISEVTLYPGSARIVRTATVNSGFAEVVIGHLPAGFDTDTLEVKAGQDVQIGQIVTRSGEQTEAVNPNAARLAGVIRGLQDRISRLDARVKAETLVQRYLGDVGVAEPAAAVTSTTRRQGSRAVAADIAQTAKVIRQQANTSLSAVQRLHEEKRVLTDELAARQRELNRMQSSATRTKTVAVTLNAGSAQTLTLSYQVHNAGWKPAYRGNLLSQQSVVAVSRLATVSQKTGEDWENVRLKLSSNRPDSRFVPPSPSEWELRYYPPAPEGKAKSAVRVSAGRARMAPAPRPAPLASPVAEEYAAREQRYIPPVFESSQAYSTTFTVPYPVSLSSDGREMSLTLSSEQLPVKQRLLIAPRQDTRAAVLAVADKPQGVWLPGEIQLFRDGSYIGKRSWQPNRENTQNGRQKLMFAFGQDDLVNAKSIRQQVNSENTGVFSKKRRQVRAYRYEVTNGHPFAVDVEVVDASPVSTDSKVQVQSSYDPKPTTESWRDRRGVVAWEQRVPAQSTSAFSVRYTVEYPQEGRLHGM